MVPSPRRRTLPAGTTARWHSPRGTRDSPWSWRRRRSGGRSAREGRRPSATGRTNGEISWRRRGRVGRSTPIQLCPSQVSKVSPTQYDGRWARTCITRVLPRAPAQSRVQAVGEAEIAADPGSGRPDCRRATSWAGVPESPASAPGTPMEPPVPACAKNVTRDEPHWAPAGRGRRRPAAVGHAPANAARARRRDAARRRWPTVHISVRAHSPQGGPGHDVEAEAEVDGLRPRHRHEAGRRAEENSRSRRDGTWKECTTRTATKSTVSGSSTDVMPAVGSSRLRGRTRRRRRWRRPPP